METWDEIRTAYHAARLGTVSGAADVLGVHHATVIRHIDALEKRLGTKLFQRHPRGYTATEAGLDLMRVAQATEDQFAQLSGRIRGGGSEVRGEVIVTSVPELRSLLTPTLVQFRDRHPGIAIRFLAGDRLFRLEYGEAHVAIRAGNPPEQPDNVIQPLVTLRHALYASSAYVARQGLPADEAALVADHDFIGDDADALRPPFLRWLRDTVPPERVTYRSSDILAMHEAVLAGAGIGFMPVYLAAQKPDLVQILPPRPGWSAQLWLVTHVDLHRTTKVQACLAALKEAARSWENI
ncbi:LysR family transcriptional regulator [Halodurantibacterium flavum]|uniref:LysR family transcriptional regulator n=1 Tax=Halodurantibacterium flavum TaxID=1382802 RepID=A0ABW4S3F7_9RHOB